ncbi:hypothetical protein VHEMI09721 [[Torrubiella] hemipterigena]|uniref:Uncharacterized protein n=1 Tax=[Torrubiella] hemipterigena TaxID=1531966 RepID=A0A0A1TQX3_9HYPO|nr:hypothetical protein VHEMI09721 [[Torrubiella] hemipterigena]
MELYAAGCNAWQQLVRSSGVEADHVADVQTFQCILRGQTIQPPVSTIMSTLVRHDRQYTRLGYETARPVPEHEAEFHSVASASGSRLYGPIEHSTVRQTSKLRLERTGVPDVEIALDKPVVQMAAYDTGFAVLYTDGTVATMGDPRFPECLGREVSDKQPSNALATVDDLEGLDDPVTHISAASYTLAALTKSGCIYAWGRSSSGTHRQPQALSNLEGMPNYAAVAYDTDIADVAIGDGHAIALTTEGTVYVIGSNSNGQLGLGDASVSRVDDWTKLDFQAPTGNVISRVAAGPRTSFIITAKQI